MENQTDQPIAYPSEIQLNQSSETPPINQPLLVQPSTESSKQSYLKMAVIVMALLLVIMGGLVIYIFQKQTPSQPVISNTVPTSMPTTTSTAMIDTTANWKTYTNEDIGFSVKHPIDLTVSQKDFNAKNDSIALVKWGPMQGADSELYDGISLLIVPINLNNQTLENYVTKEIEASKENADILENIKGISINGAQGFTYTAKGLGTHRYIYLQRDNNSAIEIVDSTVDPAKLGFDQTVSQILSTFKFTDQTQSSTNWKTYTNSRYNYTLKYPADWTTVALNGSEMGAVRETSEMFDIQSRDLLLGNATVQIIQSLPDRITTFQTVKMGLNTYQMTTEKTEGMVTNSYFLKLPNNSYLEIITRPAGSENEEIFNSILESVVTTNG